MTHPLSPSLLRFPAFLIVVGTMRLDERASPPRHEAELAGVSRGPFGGPGTDHP
jgi:hypothetical protein